MATVEDRPGAPLLVHGDGAAAASAAGPRPHAEVRHCCRSGDKGDHRAAVVPLGAGTAGADVRSRRGMDYAAAAVKGYCERVTYSREGGSDVPGLVHGNGAGAGAAAGAGPACEGEAGIGEGIEGHLGAAPVRQGAGTGGAGDVGGRGGMYGTAP